MVLQTQKQIEIYIDTDLRLGRNNSGISALATYCLPRMVTEQHPFWNTTATWSWILALLPVATKSCSSIHSIFDWPKAVSACSCEFSSVNVGVCPMGRRLGLRHPVSPRDVNQEGKAESKHRGLRRKPVPSSRKIRVRLKYRSPGEGNGARNQDWRRAKQECMSSTGEVGGGDSEIQSFLTLSHTPKKTPN